MAAPDFRMGDTVVEPTLGICKVQGIRQMSVDGQLEDFFILEGAQARVLVPRSQLVRRGVRSPLTKEEVKKIHISLRVPVNPSRGNAREEYLEYQESLKSGDPVRISKLLRKLFLLDQTSDLKGKEKELMELARKFLVDEITFIGGESKTKITNEINDNLRMMQKRKLKMEKAKTAAAAKAAGKGAAKPGAKTAAKPAAKK